jgi:YegS/Rv2252/BmrU family lipid kinase
MKTKVVINPYSANGTTAAQWGDKSALLKQKIGNFDAELTTRPREATIIVQKALQNGYQRIIGVGGDGTVNEVVNGFFQDGKPINSDVVFSFIMTGTGGDFRKTVGISRNIDEAISQLANGTIKKIDIGKMKYTTFEGTEEQVYFDNIASFGMSGVVDQIANTSFVSKFTKKVGGTFAFFCASFLALLSYKNKTVQLDIDGKVYENITIRVVSMANGQYFGGGMWIAPKAVIDDGLLEVVVLGDLSRFRSVLLQSKVYKGDHLGVKDVFRFQGRKIIATSNEEVIVEADGEPFGRLPATFEILPQAINLKC